MKSIIKTNSFYDSTDPFVDGTNLTNNENIISRRKRKVSEVGEIHHNCKVKEFLALCEFLVGERSKPLEKPTLAHMNILACIRNNNLKYINKSIRTVINDNLDLAIRASEFKKSEILEKYNKMQNYENNVKEHSNEIIKTAEKLTFHEKLENLVKNKNEVKNKEEVKQNNYKSKKHKAVHDINRDKAIKSFMSYLNQVLDPSIIISRRSKCYHTGIVASMNNSVASARAMYMDEIVDKNRDALNKITFVKHRKVLNNITWKKLDIILDGLKSRLGINDLNNYYVKSVDNSENFILLDENDLEVAKLDKSFKVIENAQVEETENEELDIENTQIEETENTIVNNKDEHDRNMLLFIKSIKELGVKEITIKF